MNLLYSAFFSCSVRTDGRHQHENVRAGFRWITCAQGDEQCQPAGQQQQQQHLQRHRSAAAGFQPSDDQVPKFLRKLEVVEELQRHIQRGRQKFPSECHFQCTSVLAGKLYKKVRRCCQIASGHCLVWSGSTSLCFLRGNILQINAFHKRALTRLSTFLGVAFAFRSDVHWLWFAPVRV